MKISRTRFFIVIFWVIMTGWLIRYEAFPQWFSETFSGYRALFEAGPFIIDSWMQITFKDMPIGYSHTWVDSDVESQTESHTIRNKTILNLNLLGENQSISVSASATLDAQQRLQKFSTSLFSRSYATKIDGRRTGNEQFEVRIKSPIGVQQVNLSVPDDVMLYSPMTEMAVRRLKPGESLRLPVLDPLSMTVSEVTAEALRHEKFNHEGRDRETTVLQLTYQGLDMLSWIDADGRVLRHETPFGWTMTACSPDKIQATRQNALDTGDMLSAMAVPCHGSVVNPRTCRKLTLQLNGLPFDAESLSSHRQIIEQRTGPLQLSILAQPMPAQTHVLGGPVPDACRQYLASSPSVQADHPDMVSRAKVIIGGRTNSFEAAKAIFDWVQNNIEMRPTVSLPSALDVLERREGDCNEYTYLFVGLARAVGLPAQIHVGIVYAMVKGRAAFYYHAWPSVYVGEWVEMDPTWRQTTVDATHISLVKGELGNQMKLLGLLGQASVDILSEEAAP